MKKLILIFILAVILSLNTISSFGFPSESTTNSITISNGTVFDHNDLLSIQGGTTDQYYHLTSAQHSDLNTDIYNWVTLSELLNFGYYNSTDFTIGDYSTTAQMNTAIVNANTSMKNYVDSVSSGNSSWNESHADTLYAPINYGDNWNKTYADTLYDPIGGSESDPLWSSNQSLYYTSSQIEAFSYYNSSDFDISDYSTTAQIFGFGYYNASNFDISDYYPLSNPYEYYNITTLGNSYYNKTDIENFGYYNLSDFNINNYYLKSNPFGFYNISSFDINDYYPLSNPYSYYNSTTFGTDYYNKTDILGFGYYNSSDFDINDYSTTASMNTAIGNANTSMKNYVDEQSGGNSSWNESHANTLYIELIDTFGGEVSGTYDNLVLDHDALDDQYYDSEGDLTALLDDNYAPVNYGDEWNKTYADTLYDPLGGSETDPLWSSNQSLYYTITDIENRGYYNSSDFNIDDYYLKSNPYGYYNSTTIPSYIETETDPLWSGNQSSYSTTTEMNTAIENANTSMKNYVDAQAGGNSSWNESYANTLYRLQSWDNITGIPHATPSNGDTTHFSLADEIYDWVIGLAYATTTYVDNLVASVGNWSADKSDYYTSAETDTEIGNANTSMKNYVDAQAGGNSSWNESYANTLYAEITEPLWTSNQSLYYLKTEIDGFAYWNSTTALFNKTYADTLYASIGSGNSSWNETYARTIFYDAEADLTGLLDDNYYGIDNPYGYYNSTNPSPDTDTNLTEDDVESYVFDDDNTANLGMNNYNVTNVSYTTFCNGANCWKMYVNASDYFIIEEI